MKQSTQLPGYVYADMFSAAGDMLSKANWAVVGRALTTLANEDWTIVTVGGYRHYAAVEHTPAAELLQLFEDRIVLYRVLCEKTYSDLNDSLQSPETTPFS